MPNEQQKPAMLAAIEDARKDAKTPEDHAVVDQWQAEFDAERQAIDSERGKVVSDLGHETVNFVQHAGVVVPEEAVQQARAEGQEINPPSTAGRQGQ